MKAIQVCGYGGLDQLKMVDLPIPTPSSDEVLIKVSACAMNNTEIWMREGAYGDGKQSGWKTEGVTFPRIPGSDVAGTIVGVGQDCDPALIGTNVVLFPFKTNSKHNHHFASDIQFLGSEVDGGYAQYVVWPASLCYPMPLDNFHDSCVFSVSGLTAWHMCELLKIQPNTIVVVSGASGGVGLFNVQIAAKVFNATVIAIVGDVGCAQTLKNLGATHVVSYHSPTLHDDILHLAQGKVDYVLDVVGDALFTPLLNVIKAGGAMCISGSIGGQKTQIDLRTLYLNHITLMGSVLGTQDDYRQLLDAVKQGIVVPIIDRVYQLEDVHQAQTYFKASGKLGKIVLDMG